MTTKLNIKEIKPNPNNPRVIRGDKLTKLKESIKTFPQMLELRPLVLNEKNEVLGGNMRLKALNELGITEVPVIFAHELTEEQQKEFVIKDNVSYGQWEWEQLEGFGFDTLEQWGLDVPTFTDVNLTNDKEYEGLTASEKLERFKTSEIKTFTLAYNQETYEQMVEWLDEINKTYKAPNYSELIRMVIETISEE